MGCITCEARAIYIVKLQALNEQLMAQFNALHDASANVADMAKVLHHDYEMMKRERDEWKARWQRWQRLVKMSESN